MKVLRQSPCRGCGKLIFWIVTKAGRSMPCDPEGVKFMPMPGAKEIYVTLEGNVVKGKPDPEGMLGYVSHFATCPAAAQFKRK